MRFLSLLMCLFLSLPATRALAQPEDGGAQVDLARRHFQSAGAYFEEGRYDEAAREFLETWKLAPRPDLLFNVAHCYLRKGDAARAIGYFERYLADLPVAKDREAIERQVAELKRRVGTVRVEGAPAGSEVVVDGVSAGAAPLGGPVPVTAS